MPFSVNTPRYTYWTHYTYDSLSQEARIDVICSLSSPLKQRKCCQFNNLVLRQTKFHHIQYHIWCEMPFVVLF